MHIVYIPIADLVYFHVASQLKLAEIMQRKKLAEMQRRILGEGGDGALSKSSPPLPMNKSRRGSVKRGKWGKKFKQM